MQSIPPPLIIFTFSVLFFILGMFFEDVRKSHEYTSLFIVIGAVGTWLALFVNSSTTRTNARKQHTINIIFNTRLNSSLYMQHLRRLRKVCQEGCTLDETAFIELKQKRERHELDAEKTIESIHYLLNYYEFLAVGARTGDLDEELLRQTLRAPYLRLVRELDGVITHYRGLQVNHYGSKTLEHLVHLRDKWLTEDVPPSNSH